MRRGACAHGRQEGPPASTSVCCFAVCRSQIVCVHTGARDSRRLPCICAPPPHPTPSLSHLVPVGVVAARDVGHPDVAARAELDAVLGHADVDCAGQRGQRRLVRARSSSFPPQDQWLRTDPTPAVCRPPDLSCPTSQLLLPPTAENALACPTHRSPRWPTGPAPGAGTLSWAYAPGGRGKRGRGDGFLAVGPPKQLWRCSLLHHMPWFVMRESAGTLPVPRSASTPLRPLSHPCAKVVLRDASVSHQVRIGVSEG